MAKINVEIDTDNNSMIVKLNDEILSDVQSVNIYKHDKDAFYFDICCECQSESGLRERETYSWSSPYKGYARASNEIKHTKINGDIHQTIAKLIKR